MIEKLREKREKGVLEYVDVVNKVDELVDEVNSANYRMDRICDVSNQRKEQLGNRIAKLEAKDKFEFWWGTTGEEYAKTAVKMAVDEVNKAEPAKPEPCAHRCVCDIYRNYEVATKPIGILCNYNCSNYLPESKVLK